MDYGELIKDSVMVFITTERCPKNSTSSINYINRKTQSFIHLSIKGLYELCHPIHLCRSLVFVRHICLSLEKKK